MTFHGTIACNIGWYDHRAVRWLGKAGVSDARTMGKDEPKLPAEMKRAEIDAFLRQVAAAPMPIRASGMGRLIFALDATASRQPTWDRACHIQAEMFAETAS